MLHRQSFSDADSKIAVERIKEKERDPFVKRVLVVDDEPDVAYDLLLVDVYMPGMDGFELSQRILELDLNIRVCFASAAELSVRALREVYPKLSFGCFIKNLLK
jgi:CheY-like chemotaxis protein